MSIVRVCFLTSIEQNYYYIYMNSETKRTAALFSALASLFFSSSLAFATSLPSQPLCPSAFSSLCAIQPQNSGGIVGSVIQILLIIAIIVSLFFFVWGGVRWIMSGGDKAKVEQARSGIIASLVGLAISLLAFFILNLILVFFTGQGLSVLQLPKLYSGN